MNCGTVELWNCGYYTPNVIFKILKLSTIRYLALSLATCHILHSILKGLTFCRVQITDDRVQSGERVSG